MLVDKKFIYISIPRCASTSFHISCIKKGLSVEQWSSEEKYNFQHDNLSNMEIAHRIPYIHQRVFSIISSFGDSYEMISVRRDPYERFVSYFNHCIGELKRTNNISMYEKFKTIELQDLMFFKREDVADKQSIKSLAKNFLNGMGFFNYTPVIESLIMPIFAHPSYYHSNDGRIRWFDFNDLSKLEKWVSDKCEIDFKLENFGSSKEYESKIIINDQFIKKYDEIYSSYENFKKEKTII